MSRSRTSLRKNQSGLVSFMVVTIIMLVLTLIVLAFARLVRREQVQTLDRQLNAQAFYAAESGVNDAINALASPAPPTAYNDNCNGPGSFIDRAVLTSDLGNGVAYSCLLVDTSVPNLVIDNVPTDSSVILPIRPDGPDPITNLEFVITDSAGGGTLTGCPAVGTYPGNWPAGCRIGMLRLELVAFNTNPDRGSLLRNRIVAFIQPTSGGGGTPGFSWAQSSDLAAHRTGYRHGATCTVAAGAARCNVDVDITGLNIGTGFLRLRSAYRSVGVTVSARSSAGPVDLIGAQAEVDVTGRVSGVIKRIKVRRPIPVSTTSAGPLPEFVLHSKDTLCKRFQITGPPANALSFGIFLNSTTGANDDCNPGQTANN
jgi:hypothetical protein